MRPIVFALSCLLLACGATVPDLEQPSPEQLIGPLRDQVAQSQKAAKYASDRLEAQIQALSRDAQAASQAAEEARRSVQVGASMPQIFVREKVVPVVDSAFRPGDRESLLSRAAEQSQRLQEAVVQLHDLGTKIEDMQAQVGLQEFASSPGTFVETHGISGLVALVLSIASYLVGKRKRA